MKQLRKRRDATSPRSHRARPELIYVVAVTTLISASFVAVGAADGAFGAARNDDWSYYRVAFDFARNRHFHVDGWIQTMLVGHTVLAWPFIALFGDSVRALQVVCVVAGVVGVVFSYALIRRSLPPAWSAFACLTLLVGPIFGSLAVSYMTDTTAFATQVATLLAGVKALESRSVPRARNWMVVAALLGFVAVSIREYAIVAFPAVFVVATLRSWSDRRARLWFVEIGMTFAVATFALFVWRRSLPLSVSPGFNTSPGPGNVKKVARAMTTLALLVSPIVATMSPRRVVARVSAIHRALSATAVAAGGLCILVAGSTLLGNYVTDRGSYPGATIDATNPGVIPHRIFQMAVLAADYAFFIGVFVLARALAGRRGAVDARGMRRAFIGAAEEDPALTVIAVYTSALIIVYIGVIVVLKETFFDRYLISIVPFVAALLLVAARRYELLWPRHSLAAAVTAVVVFAVFGFLYVDAAATIDGAKWRAGQRLVSSGFDPATVDAGYEWFGFHQRDAVTNDGHGDDLVTRLFSPRPVCATVVLNGTEQGARKTARRHTLLFRQVVRTLLGRRVIVSAVAGPTRCPNPAR